MRLRNLGRVGFIAILGMVLLLAVGAACGDDDVEGGELQFEFDKVVEAARAEGELIVRQTTPNTPELQNLMIQVFKDRFDLPNISTSWEMMGGRANTARIQVEFEANEKTPDVMSAGGSGSYLMVDQGIAINYPWVDVFGDELEGMADAVNLVGDELKGSILHFWDSAYVLGFNTDQLSADEVPGSLEELTDPKWSGKISIQPSGIPFHQLSLLIGDERTEDLVKRLADNKPILRQNSPAIMGSVTSGEAAIGIVNPSAAERDKAKGAPVDWKPFSEGMPLFALTQFVSANATNPNMAVLFTAWMVTEGRELGFTIEKFTRLAPGSMTFTLAQERSPGVQTITEQTRADIDITTGRRAKYSEIFTE